ncbi:MAG: hypothetical protein JNK49_22105 [Planctomycetes bacterium]|nr:hypothetical protein [Planctomycetota bacterium]
MKRTKSRRVHPVAAGLVFAGSLAFVAHSVFGGWSDQGGTGPVDERPPADLSDGQAVDEPLLGVDLLARHGSYEKGQPVRSAFVLVVEAAAAPAGEVVAAERRRWAGADPPQLTLGMVMVSAAARRAVFEGRVVGVGDQVGDCRIEAIERGAVHCSWQGRPLTYELGDRVPREFRAELALRAAEAADKSAGAGPSETAAPTASTPEVDDPQAKNRGRQ